MLLGGCFSSVCAHVCVYEEVSGGIKGRVCADLDCENTTQ